MCVVLQSCCYFKLGDLRCAMVGLLRLSFATTVFVTTGIICLHYIWVRAALSYHNLFSFSSAWRLNPIITIISLVCNFCIVEVAGCRLAVVLAAASACLFARCVVFLYSLASSSEVYCNHILSSCRHKERTGTRAKQAGCSDIKLWIQPASNDLYWCAALGDSNKELLVDMWKSLVEHIAYVHSRHEGLFTHCAHYNLGDRQC